MSPVRGRALIINNASFSDQHPGPELDVINITDMLKQFKFKVSMFDDITAEVKLTLVKVL